MSHHYKRPPDIRHLNLRDVQLSVDPQKMRLALAEPDEQERELSLMALTLPDEDALEAMLAGAEPMMRKAMIDRLRPFLRFEVTEVTPDCPVCGLKRGSAIPHECLAN